MSPGDSQDGPPEPQRQKAVKNFEDFLSAFGKSAKMMEELIGVIDDQDNGLIVAINELTDELQAHRAEMQLLRAAISGTKVNVDLGEILNGIRRRTRS